MKKQTGLTLIEILVPLAVITITLVGGVMVWKKRISPVTPTPTPTPTISSTPTFVLEPSSTQYQQEQRNLQNNVLLEKCLERS